MNEEKIVMLLAELKELLIIELCRIVEYVPHDDLREAHADEFGRVSALIREIDNYLYMRINHD